MTMDEFRAMAREARLEKVADNCGLWPDLVRLAALAVGREREVCAQLCDAVVAANDQKDGSFEYGAMCAAENLSASIRARNNP